MIALIDNVLMTPTGTLPLGGYFLSNLLTSRLSRRCRWDDGSLVSVEFDLGSAIGFEAIAIISHNLTSGATINVKTGTTSGFVTPTDTFSITHAEKNIYQAVTQSTATRYVRFEFTDTSNPDGYIDIGKLVADDKYIFPGFAPVVSRDSIDKGRVERSGTDQVYGTKRYRLQRISVQFPWISQSARAGYETYLDIGQSTPHVIYIDESDNCSVDFGVKTLYTTIEGATASLEMNTGRAFSSRLTLREAY